MENREILFKAKSVATGKWIEGYYIGANGVNEIMNNHGARVEIDPATICQSTGLLDSEGNRIWEGDVTRSAWHDNRVVEWRNGSFWSIQINGEGKYPFSFLGTPAIPIDFEVIGNRFDNPELLTPQP